MTIPFSAGKPHAQTQVNIETKCGCFKIYRRSKPRQIFKQDASISYRHFALLNVGDVKTARHRKTQNHIEVEASCFVSRIRQCSKSRQLLNQDASIFPFVMLATGRSAKHRQFSTLTWKETEQLKMKIRVAIDKCTLCNNESLFVFIQNKTSEEFTSYEAFMSHIKLLLRSDNHGLFARTNKLVTERLYNSLR